MQILRNMKIRHKLTAIIMLTSTLAVLIGMIAIHTQEYFEVREKMVASFSTYAAIISDNSKAAVAFSDRNAAEEVLSALSSAQDATFACIYDSDGRVFAKYQRLDIGANIQAPEVQEQGNDLRGDFLSIFRDITLDGERIGTIYLQVSLQAMKEGLWHDSLVGVGIAMGVLVFAYFLSWKLQAVVSGPVRELADIATRVSRNHDYSLRAPKQSDDELGTLVVSFNEMLNQIQRRDIQLLEVNENLEETVSERTSNLARANEQLQTNEIRLKQANEQLQSEVVERRKAEQELEASNNDLELTVQKLSQSNQQLQEFVYVASHDLREPVRKISSFGQMLSESLGGTLSDDNEENFGFMIDGANRMQQMIESLLVYSRVTTKTAEFEDVDLNIIVEQLQSFELAGRIEDTGAHILVPQSLPVIKGDPAQMCQLLQNLIGNGLKYQRKEVAPKITIRSCSQEDGMMRIEIEDNGIGIKAEQCENVFVMFRRLHSRQEYEGTGIGLAVCKRIVERHRGKIGVTSTYGQGSTFWFTLPVVTVGEEDSKELVSSLDI